MLGCNQEDCLSDSEITNSAINIITMKAFPNRDLFTIDTEEVSFSLEASRKHLWPEVSQRSNIFYMRS